MQNSPGTALANCIKFWDLTQKLLLPLDALTDVNTGDKYSINLVTMESFIGYNGNFESKLIFQKRCLPNLPLAGGGGGGSGTNCRTQGVLTVLFGFFRRDTTTPTLSTGD